MGKGSQRIPANSTNEDSALSSREADHVGGSSKEDRDLSARQVGKNQAAEEEGGCLEGGGRWKCTMFP